MESFAKVACSRKTAFIGNFCNRNVSLAKKLSADGEEDIPEEVKVLVEERKAARKAKDFAKADELRDKIGELGYIVEETRQGTKIKKK